MSAAVALSQSEPASRPTPGISLTVRHHEQAALLPPAALALLVSLHRAIEPGRQARRGGSLCRGGSPGPRGVPGGAHGRRPC